MRKSKRRRTTKNTGDIASRVRFKKKKKIRVIVCRVPYGRLGSKCESAIQAGDLDELKRLVVHGSQLRFTSRLCARAAEVGHLETLKWLRSERFPWDWATCAFAAWRGHLEVLKWARANGCPWDEETWKYAAKRGDAAVVRWLRLNGCPKKRVRWKVPLETVHVFRKETNRTSAPRGAVSSRQTPGV